MDLIDLKTLAERTPFSVSTYRNYIKKGLPYYRVGRKILINQPEFEEWLKQFKVSSSQGNASLDALVNETIADMGLGCP